MSQPPPRRIFLAVLKNFLNSFRPRQIRGDLKGSDYFGNKYFEIPANPSLGKRRASRWFEPREKDNFEQEMPAEWEAWLRGRRQDPPGDEEIMRNLAIMEAKKKNAVAIDAKGGVPAPMKKGMETFPKMPPEFELMPGKRRDE